ncbi:MAG: hypothetical protein IKP77_05570 [Acholeplasmatales bacterium]|nr:hypothetical protein [Acholeplasmatales bacterium]
MIIFFTGLRDFNKIVTKGDLDRFILRPRGVLFQILSSNSDWFVASYTIFRKIEKNK